MKKIKVAFGIHNHQPVGNFDFVFEEAHDKAYFPFLELLEQHPGIRMVQHYSGILLEWLKQNKPGFLPRLKKLVQSGQVELMTGGFYEPILSIIPYQDKVGQINKLTQFLRQEIGYEPKGMWLAERIWEPHLPQPCSEAGVKYVVLDDSHFKNAGLREADMLGYYLTEEEGATVALFPISEKLRYTIPFQPVDATIEYLASLASDARDVLVVFADDGEKFGIWPGTYEHCYEKGWLEAFFHALEQNAEWIEIVHLADAVQNLRPLGRIYLPTASYREMMEWAMPTESILDYQAFENQLKQTSLHERYKVFVRGGFWRNFLAKYPESNNMHKKMLYLNQRLGRLAEAHAQDERFEAAQDHIWAGQCNCPYWHGVFGGLYLNHLRFATYREFLRAELLLDALEQQRSAPRENWTRVEVSDFDRDGYEEILISNASLNLYFTPNHGGALFELDYKPATVNLLDTMTRRPESYHEKLRQLAENKAAARDRGEDEGAEQIASIHDLVLTKEEGLENLLFYDWYRRLALVDHFLGRNVTLPDFARCDYEEAGDFVGAAYEQSFTETSKGVSVRLWRDGEVQLAEGTVKLRVEKEVYLPRDAAEIRVAHRVKNLDMVPCTPRFGVEWDFALLAGDAPDRNYVFPGKAIEDTRLRSVGEVAEVTEVRLEDAWLNLRIALYLEREATVWRFPIETISQSEGGFERVYQSSVVLPHWRFELAPGETWETQARLKVSSLSRERGAPVKKT